MRDDSESPPEVHYATNYAAFTAYAQLLLHKIWKRVWEGSDEQPDRVEGPAGPPGLLQKWNDFWYTGMSEVSTGLYVGSAADAAAAPNLHELGIALVVNVTADIPNFFEGAPGAPDYVRVPMVDAPNATFQDHAEATKQALAKIKEARAKGSNVLVHCLMGASRSVALASLAVAEETRCTAAEAYDAVRRKRTPARINVSFVRDIEQRHLWLWLCCPATVDCTPKITPRRSRRCCTPRET